LGCEKGLGGELAWSRWGAFLGHELFGGGLGTVGGVIAGAVGANILEKKHEKYVLHSFLSMPLIFC